MKELEQSSSSSSSSSLAPSSLSAAPATTEQRRMVRWLDLAEAEEAAAMAKQAQLEADTAQGFLAGGREAGDGSLSLNDGAVDDEHRAPKSSDVNDFEATGPLVNSRASASLSAPTAEMESDLRLQLEAAHLQVEASAVAAAAAEAGRAKAEAELTSALELGERAAARVEAMDTQLAEARAARATLARELEHQHSVRCTLMQDAKRPRCLTLSLANLSLPPGVSGCARRSHPSPGFSSNSSEAAAGKTRRERRRAPHDALACFNTGGAFEGVTMQRWQE